MSLLLCRKANTLDCTDKIYRKALCGSTALGPSTEYFNTYDLVNADAIYNGQRHLESDERVVFVYPASICRIAALFYGKEKMGRAQNPWSKQIEKQILQREVYH